SAATGSFNSPRGPSQSWASSAALAFGLCSGHSGKRDSVGVGAGSTAENADDMAHLEDRHKYFAFISPCQELFLFFFAYIRYPALFPNPSRHLRVYPSNAQRTQQALPCGGFANEKGASQSCGCFACRAGFSSAQQLFRVGACVNAGLSLLQALLRFE